MSRRLFCCQSCFANPWLRATVLKFADSEGDCLYCGLHGALAYATLLSDAFRNLLSDYLPAKHANGGKDDFFPALPPLQAIQRDWSIFSEAFIAKGGLDFLPVVFHGKARPERIANLQEPVVAFHRNAMSTAFDKWMEFRMDKRNFSRWWSVNPPHFDPELPGTMGFMAMSHFSPMIRTLSAGNGLWRARSEYLDNYPSQHHSPLPVSQMSSNPRFPASRLNRDGQAVLYCSETEKTAIAEIRPGRGYICTTCEVQLTRDIEVLDLAAPLAEINPFTCKDLSWKLDLRRVAKYFSSYIAEPVSRGEDPIFYRGTQCFADMVRAINLAGIRFASSLENPKGVNVALFDPGVVELYNPRLVYITKTELSYEVYDTR